MPIYEYQCEACGKIQSVLQKVSDRPPTVCKSCEKGPLTKIVSRTSFILKGTGWYVTDFRDKNKSPDSKESDSESDANSDEGAKPAAPEPADKTNAKPSDKPPANSSKPENSGKETKKTD